jgi:uncharacterized repeat protein (TIGR01451 family)
MLVSTPSSATPVNTFTISGQVFRDSNGNAIKEAGDSGLSGWTVFLDANNNGTLDSGEPSIITDAQGNYAFTLTAPPVGSVTIKVREVLPAGWLQTTSNPADITVTSAGGTFSGRDFGNFQKISISGQVFNDLNGDGLKGPGDSGITGWTVFLDSNGDGLLDNGETSLLTDAQGNYSFNNLGPGTYRVREVKPAGWIQKTGNPVDIIAASGANVNEPIDPGLNFGNFQLITISGVVFNDFNGNGTRDAGEPGVSGRTVFLDTNNNGALDNGEPSTISAGDGSYSFVNLGPGTYRVRAVLPVAWTQTSANPSAIVSASGTNVSPAGNPGLGFATFHTVTISGFVFEDFNANGLIDAGEPPLAGRTVYIDANNNGILDAGDTPTTTGANGSYSFTSLGPGNYTVRLVVQAGWDPASTSFSFTALSGALYAVNLGVVPQFVVTNTNSAGAGSLCQAILDANQTAGVNVIGISFGIPGSGLQSIALTSALPPITHPVSIDGTTQPGYAGSPLIELNGSGVGSSGSGIVLSGGNSTVKGLVINRFAAFGIVLAVGGGDVIAGNYIGTDVSGTTALGNLVGVWISGVTANTIGGATIAARNVISGNTAFGVQIGDDSLTAFPSTGNSVQGNYLGTNASGTAALPNGRSGIYLGSSASNDTIGGTDAGAGNLISGNVQGVFINGHDNFVQGNLIGTDKNGTAKLPNTNAGILIGESGNLIGGTTSAARNIISGNNRGIFISSTAASNKVQGNYIGTDITGAAALGNSLDGIALTGTNNVIGGTVAGAGNVISDNFRGGVSILGRGTTGNLLQGNLIGTKADGTNPLGNHDSGVTIGTFASNNTVGGTQQGAGNIIAFNTNAGVFLDSRFGNPLNNAILSNSIFNNTGLGIDLAPSGVTPNDPGDGDTGANNLQNFPALSFANQAGSGTGVAGLLNSTPNTSFRIEFFLNQSCDPSGNGQGNLFVAASNVTTDANGIAPISTSVAPAFDTSHWFITSTATRLDTQGNPIETSEFSNCVRVPFADVSITGTGSPNQVRSGDNLTYTLTVANNGPDASTNVSVSNQLPSSVTMVSCTATAGAVCSNVPSGNVTVQINSLASGAQVTITIVAKVGITTAQLTDTATVFNTDVYDPAPNNNSVTIKTDIAPGTAVQFGQPTYVVAERAGSISINVTRTGDTSAASSVDYATDDGSVPSVAVPCSAVTGNALERCDYTRATGTLQFAANETQKNFTVLVNDDSYTEGSERLNLVLSNPVGAVLGLQSTAALQITDDVPESVGNPVDDSSFFVRQHYHDFLNREPDQSGLDFWTNEIESCSTNQPCRDVKHVNVSGAFFLSIEFQETGYLVERIYKTAFGDSAGSSNFPTPHQVPVPTIRLYEFLRDTQHISQGVVVGVGDWQGQLESNKQGFALEFVSRARFTSAYPLSLTADQFITQLNGNAGQVLTAADISQLEALFGGAAASSNNNANRASVLRQIAENATLKVRESNQAFVLMQYFGYLRRNPNDSPDADYTGYDFWLQKLNQFNGDFVQAEMVNAFISSSEYRHRFGSP